jgi:cell division septation protein DedD
VDAETNLGLLLFQNGNQAEGLKWLRKAAEQDDPRALLVYGTALFNGDGVSQDRMLGYAYVSRSAAQGLVPAQQTLAQLDQLVPAADRTRALALAPVKSAPVKTKPAATPQSAKPARMAQAKVPAPKPVVVAPSKPAAPVAASGAWRIQLGAFSQRGGAEALYRRLADKPALAGRGPFYIPAGAMTRLQVGPFASRGAAASACASLGTACFPVPAR